MFVNYISNSGIGLLFKKRKKNYLKIYKNWKYISWVEGRFTRLSKGWNFENTTILFIAFLSNVVFEQSNIEH